MARAGKLLFTLMVYWLMLAVGLLLGFKALLDNGVDRSWLYLTLGFALAGAALGAVSRRSDAAVWVRAICLVLVSGMLAGFLLWLYPVFDAACEIKETGPAGDHLPLSWAASALVLSLPVALIRRRTRNSSLHQVVSDDEALAFIEENGLFVSDEEMTRIGQVDRPYKCPICRHEYTGEEAGQANWKLRWVRCPRAEEHVYHAYDFERAGWRCPLDKSLMYKPRY